MVIVDLVVIWLLAGCLVDCLVWFVLVAGCFVWWLYCSGILDYLVGMIVGCLCLLLRLLLRLLLAGVAGLFYCDCGYCCI